MPSGLIRCPTVKDREATEQWLAPSCLLPSFSISSFGRETFLLARYVAESLWAAWVIHWQVANSSPQGGLAVLMADYLAVRGLKALFGASEDAEPGNE